MTTAAITPQYERPVPMPFDFIGTKRFTEKLDVIDTVEGVCISVSPSSGYTTPAYFVFVATPFGDMRLDVSKKVFDLTERGDKLIVRYQRGRWTGALKGKIAR